MPDSFQMALTMIRSSVGMVINSIQGVGSAVYFGCFVSLLGGAVWLLNQLVTFVSSFIPSSFDLSASAEDPLYQLCAYALNFGMLATLLKWGLNITIYLLATFFALFVSFYTAHFLQICGNKLYNMVKRSTGA